MALGIIIHLKLRLSHAKWGLIDRANACTGDGISLGKTNGK